MHGLESSLLSFDCEGDKLNIKRDLGDHLFLKFYICFKKQLALRYSNAKRCILPMNEIMTYILAYKYTTVLLYTKYIINTVYPTSKIHIHMHSNNKIFLYFLDPCKNIDIIRGKLI